MSEIRWRHSPDTTHVDSGDRVVALDLTSEDPRPQALEGTGAAIWRLLAEPHTEAEVVAELVEQYEDVEADRVALDVTAFLQQLQSANLVRTDE